MNVRLPQTIRTLTSLICGIGIWFGTGTGATEVWASAPTRPTVVLLTSVDFDPHPLIGRPYDERIAQAFHAHFDSRFDVVIRSQADSHDLRQSLASPQNIAVFWLSHAGGASTPTTGLHFGTIADHLGFDVRDAFQEIHPNLRFLGVIGCRSLAGLLEQLRSHGLYEKNPELSVAGFDSRTEVMAGLRKTLALSDHLLRAPAVTGGYESACEARWGYRVRVARYLPNSAEYYPAARIMHRGRVLGSFAASSRQGYQLTDIFLPENATHSRADLKLVLDTGSNGHLLPGQVEPGELHLSAWEGAQWKVFATPRRAASHAAAEPIGVTSRIYRFEGVLPADAGAIPTLQLPFDCQPMVSQLHH